MSLSHETCEYKDLEVYFPQSGIYLTHFALPRWFERGCKTLVRSKSRHLTVAPETDFDVL
jgi:hypothetical protein